jgi:DNA-binding MarR family transcriptional regulator
MIEGLHLNDHIGFLLGSTYNYLHSLLTKRLIENGVEIPTEQSKVINFISYNEGITQQELAEWMKKLKPGISRIVDQLEQKGYLQRQYDTVDRRNKRLFLTDKGGKVLLKIRNAQKSVLSELQENIPEDELHVFKQVIRKISENAQNQLK